MKRFGLRCGITLNELDWWISDQWETYVPNGVKEGRNKGSSGWYSYAKKYTDLKVGFVVRYADDFKIMCRTYEDAKRWYHATVAFLKKRLKLDISPEKSKVVNLKKNSSDFLGFKIKVLPKGKTRCGYIAKTDMSDKAIQKAKYNLKARVINIREHQTVESINLFNLSVLGVQNYYCIATNIYNNITDVSYALLPSLRIRLRDISRQKQFREMSEDFQKKAVGIMPHTKIFVIGGMPLLPVTGVHHRNPMNFSQGITSYTAKGREKIHQKVECVTSDEINSLERFRNQNETMEFSDNQVSAYLVQQGYCYISGRRLDANQMICIRKKPINIGGSDSHRNIAFVEADIGNLILESNKFLAERQLQKSKLDKKQLRRLNRLRENYGNQPIK